MARGAWAYEEEVEYIRRSWDGIKVVSEKVKTKAIRLNDITDKKNSYKKLTGTYYVTGYHDFIGSIAVKEGCELNLIICDGAYLHAQSILVRTPGTSTLRIFAQEQGTGSINTEPTVEDNEIYYPAIGVFGGNGGVIEIHGGNITAKGRKFAAGIGAGLMRKTDTAWTHIYTGYNFDRLDIYGGTITATGGEEAAGIGGSRNTENGVVNIYGGTVKAYGGNYGAGIGGGNDHCLSQINIAGGTVYAYAGVDAAGIGGGEDSPSGRYINISGGHVEAYGNYDSSGCGAGIGGGQDASGGNIAITGGHVEAHGGTDAAGIGSGEETTSGPNIDGGNITITGGHVEAYGNDWGCAIGGGERAAMGNIAITGGLVHAYGGGSHGDGAGAIGGHDTTDGANSLFIGNGVKAWDLSRSAMNYERYGFCSERREMWLCSCNHNGTWGPATCTDKGDGTHDIAGCRYCYTSNEMHNFSDNLHCDQCSFQAADIATVFSGSGTQEDPYLIQSSNDWNILADYSMAASTKGVYFRQTADLNIRKTLGISEAQHVFGGIYDGDGHSISVSDFKENILAPFPHIEDATIRGLHIIGTMGGVVCAGGLVGITDGTCLVENCRVSALIFGDPDDTYGPHLGGIVGHGNSSTLTVRGCLFDGQMTASSKYTGTEKYAGAIVGWCNNAANIQTIDCLEQGYYFNFPDGRVSLNFLNNGSTTAVKRTNCYSLSHDWASVPRATSAAKQTEVTALNTYNIPSITFYKNYVTVGGQWYNIGEYATADNLTLIDNANNSTVINDYNGRCVNVTLEGRKFYSDSNWNTLCLPFNVRPLDGTHLQDATVMELDVEGTYDSNKKTGYDRKTGTLYLYFKKANAIEAGKPYLVKWNADDAAALLIKSTDDWNTFASNVNNGTESYENKLVRLCSDIYIATMVGTQAHPFKGTFDGAGHTLNFALDDTKNQGTAPFRYISGATITNVNTTGTVYGHKHCSGLVGFADSGTNTIQNCNVAVGVTSSQSYVGGVLGHGKSSKTTITDCLFSGHIKAYADGLIGVIYGWNDEGIHSMANCLATGTYESVRSTVRMAFNDNVSVTNSYTRNSGVERATDANAMSNEELVAKLGSGWEIVKRDVVPKTISVNITDPVFPAVAISNVMSDVTSDDWSVTFKGTYDPVKIGDEGDNTKLYFSAGNTLYWPNGALTINPFRAYLQLNTTTADARSIVLTFDDGETTNVVLMDNGKWIMDNEAGAWYTLDGRKLQAKPTQRGIYIHEGKKVVIK